MAFLPFSRLFSIRSGRFARFVFGVLLTLGLVLGSLLVAYRFLAPVSTLMAWHEIKGDEVDRHYQPLARIAPILAASVIASEDARFCQHHGVDWQSLSEVMDKAKARADGPSRGASTITMQTAKNLFLWPSRSVLRKTLEIPLALLIDAVWPKRRILEIYLNIAEWGDGLFGAEAAARHYFGKSADALDRREAALLATALPNPMRRNPASPTRLHRLLAARIAARAGAMGADITCLK
ncbi:monofunctional biosynthetic peptidoglycan transglycosylase [Beijerinckia indica subsp. indica ATCC 9039]|uniref:Biosynthetic peptidoglycan transglycosylase n=2 Tax=Beijerinckia TaxID=532 RepID=B2IE53_BEII9|nr:monofunctional biosynthetic peptidoglycan transglycosylase [Beijerinckia indica subsp. indica ATCC 9039]